MHAGTSAHVYPMYTWSHEHIVGLRCWDILQLLGLLHTGLVWFVQERTVRTFTNTLFFCFCTVYSCTSTTYSGTRLDVVQMLQILLKVFRFRRSFPINVHLGVISPNRNYTFFLFDRYFSVLNHMSLINRSLQLVTVQRYCSQEWKSLTGAWNLKFWPKSRNIGFLCQLILTHQKENRKMSFNQMTGEITRYNRVLYCISLWQRIFMHPSDI